MTPLDTGGNDLARMMSYQEVVRYLNWRAGQMREDARKAKLLYGEASDLFALALEQGADALETSAQAVDKRAHER